MTLNIFSRLYGLFAISSLAVLFTGCLKDTVTKTQTYTITTPVFKTRAEVSAAINGNGTQPVKTAGKLYIRGQYIYLNEIEKGIHIIDNSNPSRPAQIAFLNIPGNLDIAVNDNILYADTYTDLLAIDISNPRKARVVNSINNFYKWRVNFYNANPDLVLADVIRKDTTVELVATEQFYYNCINCSVAFANSAQPGTPGKSSANGTAGSMASMVLMNDHLYALQESSTVGIVNISSAANPRFDTAFQAGFALQTIYPFENKLFLGSMSGMFMYDMTNPVAPVKLGEFSHVRACDPVVTDGKHAYVTLHVDAACGGAVNELNVLDIANLMSPSLVKTYTLTKPKGLSKDGNLLFVCDDQSGVRLYDASDVKNLKQLNQININNSYDVIAGNNHVMVVANDGLYQYDYSNINNIRFLSKYILKN